MNNLLITLVVLTISASGYFFITVSKAGLDNNSLSENEVKDQFTKVPDLPSISTGSEPVLIKSVRTNQDNEKQSQHSKVDDFGSITYQLSDSSFMTQLALDTDVKMSINGVVNRVRLEQTFTNPTNDWVEGVYRFPVPEDAAVDQMKMKIGDRTIIGKIQEVEQARKTYNKAKALGQKTALVESQRPNLFTTNVANIPPGGTIKVAIEYQQTVQRDQNQFSVRFPMVIGDRFTPGRDISTPVSPGAVASNTHLVKDASQVVSLTDNRVDRPVKINIDFNPGFAVSQVNGSYHDIYVQNQDDHRKTIHLAKDQSVQADRDFELTWTTTSKEESELAVFTQKKGEDHYVLLMAKPAVQNELDHDSIPREVIFIIDSSGSMDGSSMEQARKALKQAIHRLKATDRFNVIDFDDRFTPLFKEAMPAIKLNKKRGVNFANRLDANGGTMPLNAIQFAFGSRDRKSERYLRQIVFLTDGQVSNEQQILREVKSNIQQDRFFSIGIGSAPNSFLMKKLAQYGKGAFTYIGKVAEVESKMTELFKKLESPVLINNKVTFANHIYAEQGGLMVPDIYDSQYVSLIYKMDSLPKEVTFSGLELNKSFSKTISINNKFNAVGLDVLWAKRRIENLMDEYINTSDSKKRADIKDRIIKLGLENHLVTKFTALVAVDVTPSRPGDETLVSKPVAKKVKAPNTATNSELSILVGLLLLIISVFVRRLRTK